MATKKEDHVKETAVAAAKETVQVEMSQEQADEFAKHLAQKELEAKANEPEEKVLISLRFGHRRNRVPYGPGECYAPAGVADSLIAADAKALEFRLKENQSNNHLFEILQNGQSRRIGGLK